jgi:hypothetical protein
MLVREAFPTAHSVDPIAKVRQLIRRKTSERDRLLKEIAQCETALIPLRQHQDAVAGLDDEIHLLFRALLANRQLSKRTRLEIRGVYEALQIEQIITLDPEWARERGNACACPACSMLDDELYELHLEDVDTISNWRPERNTASVRFFTNAARVVANPKASSVEETYYPQVLLDTISVQGSI